LIPWRKRGVAKTDASRDSVRSFEEIVLPHLDSAYNLARWLMRNDVDAQDVVQEASLRAFRFFDGYQGGDAKAWFLAIVRNTCRNWQSRRNREREVELFDEVEQSGADDQEERLATEERLGVLRNCIENLPMEFREVLVMRELEEMSYREIADVTGLALGTVMSRLSRARKRLEDCAAGGAKGAVE
jgi:RNA polymerase sigma-70 factor (ECF subfamily)